MTRINTKSLLLSVLVSASSLMANAQNIEIAEVKETETVELLPTNIRDAYITIDQDNVVNLTARIYTGSNSCAAEGVKVGWKEVEENGVIVIKPHRTAGSNFICTFEYAPVYTELTTQLYDNLGLYYLANYGESQSMKAVSDLVPLIRSTQSGGFCAGSCPISTVTLSKDGVLSQRTNWFDFRTGETELSYEVINTFNPRLVAVINYVINNIRFAELVDPNPDQPVCADAPGVTYTVTTYDLRSEVIAQRINCKDISLEDSYAKALVRFFKREANKQFNN